MNILRALVVGTVPRSAGGAALAQGGSMTATPERMAAIDAQLKTMHELHSNMMNAKTAGERQALMAEHMKAMQGGMGMMKGMGGMAGPKSPPPNMTERQTMLEQRMDMMQTMLQMMVDRLALTPTKP